MTYGEQFAFYKLNASIKRPYSDAHQQVQIGHDVWIGANAVIFDGVKVGTGAVIGAGAIVTADVPAMTIVAGIPARKIGERFPRDIAKRVLELQWWRYDLAEWGAAEGFSVSQDVDESMTDAMQAAIDAGTAPLIKERRRRIRFDRGPAKVERLAD